MRLTIPLSASLQLLAILPASFPINACAVHAVDPTEHVGTLGLRLATTGASGAHYRLGGTFDIAGPEPMSINTRDDQDSIVQALDAGAYQATLQPGWQMTRQLSNGSFAPIPATLQDSAVIPFEIQTDTVSQIRFRFLVAGEIVTFGRGTLEVDINVEEGAAGGSGAGSGACDDGLLNGSETDVDCGGSCAPCPRGASCSANSDCSGGSCAIDICGTLVASGVLLADADWTKAGSPYVLGGTVQVGGTLTMEPGTQVFGRTQDLEAHGNLNIAGTSDDPVILHDVRVAPRGTTVAPVMVTIGHAVFHGGAPYAGGGSYGSLSLRDSVLVGTEYIYVWYPVAPAFIERNVFLQAGGVSAGTQAPINITNNYFFEQSTPYAVLNWASYGDVFVQVHGNTFASTDRIALALPPRYDSASMDGTNNFWGTADAALAPQMILDRNDDLNLATVIPFEPFLTASSAETPIPPAIIP